jgi:hypothetical protein
VHNPAFALLIALTVWVVADLIRHPFLTCPRCKGNRILRATFFGGRYRPCPRCGRSGEIKRGGKLW